MRGKGWLKLSFAVLTSTIKSVGVLRSLPSAKTRRVISLTVSCEAPVLFNLHSVTALKGLPSAVLLSVFPLRVSYEGLVKRVPYRDTGRGVRGRVVGYQTKYATLDNYTESTCVTHALKLFTLTEESCKSGFSCRSSLRIRLNLAWLKLKISRI